MNHSARRQHRFRQLTYPWRERLFGVARRQAGSPEVAEDWIQDALLRAWRDFDHLTDEIAVYAWLLKILDRVIADDTRCITRRNQLAPVLAADDAFLQAQPCAAPGPFEQTLQQQTDKQVTTAIQTLPDAFRRAVVLRDIEGLSYRELADILGIPQGTVMSRLSRGRRLLASILIRQGMQETDTDAGAMQ